MRIHTVSLGWLMVIGVGALAACSTSGNDGAPGPAGATGDAGAVDPTAAGSDPRTAANCKATPPAHKPGTSKPGDEITPAPPSIGADIPVTYFGPAPSSVNPRLVGPVTLLKSGPIDFTAGTITLPLYRGTVKSTGKPIWYVLTDTSDHGNADALGLNFSAKLAYVAGSFLDSLGVSHDVARTATLAPDGTLAFDKGTVDFTPTRTLTPGDAPNFFPPKGALQPGSVGDADYSPIIRLANAGGTVYNAPVVAYGLEAGQLDFCTTAPDFTKVHDKVVRFCPGTNGNAGTVTLALSTGFSFGKPVLYLSLDANAALPATIEAVNLAPALDYRSFVGRDDTAFSAVERLFAFANGPINEKGVNPQRQGLNSALRGDGPGPLNVLGGIPTVATDYSPLWDFNLGEWTADAIAKGYRSRMNEEFQILGMVKRGFITGPGGTKWGSTGIIVNCPIVHRFL
jgi:hypothetical protein